MNHNDKIDIWNWNLKPKDKIVYWGNLNATQDSFELYSLTSKVVARIDFKYKDVYAKYSVYLLAWGIGYLNARKYDFVGTQEQVIEHVEKIYIPLGFHFITEREKHFL